MCFFFYCLLFSVRSVCMSVCVHFPYSVQTLSTHGRQNLVLFFLHSFRFSFFPSESKCMRHHGDAVRGYACVLRIVWMKNEIDGINVPNGHESVVVLCYSVIVSGSGLGEIIHLVLLRSFQWCACVSSMRRCSRLHSNSIFGFIRFVQHTYARARARPDSRSPM